MTRRPIAAVSYLNTIPFIYGIEHAGKDLRADLLLTPPRLCAESIIDRKADIALVPSEALSLLPDTDIITDYCIGTSGPVRTVVMLSDSPLEEISTVHLDRHSLTSVKLVRILAREFWGISPNWLPVEDYSILNRPVPGSAYVLIGDKVFDYENRFSHKWDLAGEWRQFTSLPFAFAVWVARRSVPPDVLEILNQALGYGIGHIREAIEKYGYSDRPYAYDYLTQNIDYKLDGAKREAIGLFLKKGGSL